MKFFIDNNLSPKLRNLLNNKGFDTVHAADFNMQASSDEDIFQKAKEDDRIIISADTDFGFILADWEAQKPSLILFRQFSSLPDKQYEAIEFITDNYKTDLERGVIIVIEPKGIRIRDLPIY